MEKRHNNVHYYYSRRAQKNTDIFLSRSGKAHIIFILCPSVDPEYKAPVPVSQPVELTNHGYVIRNNDDGADGSANLSEQKGEKIPPGGSRGADNLRLSGRRPPTPVELGGDNDMDDFSIHSIDVKAGLQPPQVVLATEAVSSK